MMQPVATRGSSRARIIEPACPHCSARARDGEEFTFHALLQVIVSNPNAAARLCRASERGLRRWCRLRTRASSTAIQKLHDAKHYKNARRARAEHLARLEVQVDALFMAARKRWRTRQSQSEVEREVIRQKRLRAVFDKLPEVGRLTRPARARQFLIKKDNNRGTRLITSFYWVDRARQIMLRSALSPFADLHDAQYMLARDANRRGPAAVREALLTALERCDANWEFIHLDVVDFYGSISQGWLERHLGLDPAIIQHQVHLGRMMLDAPRKMATVLATQEAIREGDQRGIPQGSALSSLIAEQVMAAVIRSAVVFEELPTFIWSDNVGVLAPRHRVREVVELARTAFADHGAGPFKLTVTTWPVSKPFKFLGVWYIRREDKPDALVPWEVLNAWQASIASRLQLCWGHEIDAIEHAVDKKLARWRWCPDARRTVRAVRRLIASRRSQFSERETNRMARAEDGVMPLLA